MRFLGFVLLCQVGMANAQPIHSETLPHLDLEMTGPEYRHLVGPSFTAADPELDAILTLGKRNLDWLAHINANRPIDQQLQLSTPDTQVGIPIEAPRRSNPTIIKAQLAEVKAGLPAPMSEMLFSAAELPASTLVGDELYLQQTRLVDRVYQAASRWLLQEPYLWLYALRSNEDIRGYYLLMHEPNLAEQLTHFTELATTTQTRLQGWLISECHNADHEIVTCEEELQKSIAASAGSAANFHAKYEPKAAALYQTYFTLANPRREAIWNSQKPLQFLFPFAKHESAAVNKWLATNIEDEWRFGDWQLTLDFRDNGQNLAHVVFEPGATPNVNELGGDTITMDANRSIDEYISQWTIRHEFGHVLGLPDCYVEFYDWRAGEMINYQIDTTNLMCSRRGKLQQIHIDELRKNYYRP